MLQRGSGREASGSFNASRREVRGVSQRVQTVAMLRLVWIMLSGAVLLYCQYVFDGRPNSDSEEVLIILMFILSLPASFVAGAFAVAVVFGSERLLHAPLHTSRLEMLFVWSLFFVAGYLQWFMLVPPAWSKWKAFLTRKHADSERRS